MTFKKKHIKHKQKYQQFLYSPSDDGEWDCIYNFNLPVFMKKFGDERIYNDCKVPDSFSVPLPVSVWPTLIFPESILVEMTLDRCFNDRHINLGFFFSSIYPTQAWLLTFLLPPFKKFWLFSIVSLIFLRSRDCSKFLYIISRINVVLFYHLIPTSLLYNFHPFFILIIIEVFLLTLLDYKLKKHIFITCFLLLIVTS